MTLDELIEKLEDIKKDNPISGRSKVVISTDTQESYINDVVFDSYFNELIFKI